MAAAHLLTKAPREPGPIVSLATTDDASPKADADGIIINARDPVVAIAASVSVRRAFPTRNRGGYSRTSFEKTVFMFPYPCKLYVVEILNN